MGDPKYPSRVWKRPKRPLNYDFMMEDLNTLGTYGLKNKRELWKARTELSRVRHQARSLLALRQEIREQKEPILMKSLTRIGLVKDGATLDDVLNLDINMLLSRRLQTIVQRKFAFKTPYQARQAIVHGHVSIGDRVITIPSYTVTVEEESNISLSPRILENLQSKTERTAVEETAAETVEATDGTSEEPESKDES
ncbi:30S ribosomal protein S4 [Candidatus Nitrosotenuis uzonensis]|uniref:Small ribosomal subunit protein uS4 n=1 Tax=Candidatus Nitrosotenuis uzonensis TaxID=1407055 RepID=V6ARC4_9ARCH|nr:30S ribosomal protein S4 [Candidatus Nitrosotenuis uzonensis]CDI05182.1 30S ribosomal protein S4P [Candidatus Nitrosotenuis uzonensis]